MQGEIQRCWQNLARAQQQNSTPLLIDVFKKKHQLATTELTTIEVYKCMHLIKQKNKDQVNSYAICRWDKPGTATKWLGELNWQPFETRRTIQITTMFFQDVQPTIVDIPLDQYVTLSRIRGHEKKKKENSSRTTRDHNNNRFTSHTWRSQVYQPHFLSEVIRIWNNLLAAEIAKFIHQEFQD